jgi:hypothetical protein
MTASYGPGMSSCAEKDDENTHANELCAFVVSKQRAERAGRGLTPMSALASIAYVSRNIGGADSQGLTLLRTLSSVCAKGVQRSRRPGEQQQGDPWL